MLAAVLGVAFNSAREPHEEQHRLNSVLALAPPAATTIQANRGEHRAENARQRTPATFPLIIPSGNRPVPDGRFLAAVVRSSRPESLYTVDTRSGRSPPFTVVIK